MGAILRAFEAIRRLLREPEKQPKTNEIENRKAVDCSMNAIPCHVQKHVEAMWHRVNVRRTAVELPAVLYR